MVRLVWMLFIIACIGIMSSCKNNSKEAILGGICDTSNTTFSSMLNPVITAKCISCHNNSNQSGGVSLEGYSNVVTHFDRMLTTMTNGSMPKGGDRIDNCTITKIEVWERRGKQNN